MKDNKEEEQKESEQQTPSSPSKEAERKMEDKEQKDQKESEKTPKSSSKGAGRKVKEDKEKKEQKDSEQTPKSSSVGRTTSLAVGIYVVQCGKCLKWRVIPTQEEYEDIRSNFIDDPWFCHKKAGVSCEDPTDIECDGTRTWIVDKPNIPKTPDGFKRLLRVRQDFSKCDAYYQVPNGKRVKCRSEMQQYFVENSEYVKKHKLDISDFSFTVPRVMEETIPKKAQVKVSESSSPKDIKENK